MKARTFLDKAEDTFGIRIFRKGSGPAWPEAQFEREIYAHFNVDCVFDVGANIGQFGQSLRQSSKYAGTILSFEPNPSAFEILKARSAADPKWHCYPFALSSEAGTFPLNVMQVDTFSSFRTPSQVSGTMFGDQNTIARTVQAESKRLDDCYAELAEQHGFKTPFLKMDTQGFDLEVLAGASQVVRHFVGLLSEVSVQQLYEGMPTMAESLASFRDNGFEPVELFNVHAGRRFAPLLECNCYAVRRDLLTSLVD